MADTKKNALAELAEVKETRNERNERLAQNLC